MAASNYCVPLPCTIVSERCLDERAGIISYGFIEETAYGSWTDFEDNAEWTAAINACDVIVVYDTRGEFPASSPNETDDTFGAGVDSEILSVSFTLNVEHKGIHVGAGGARTNITSYNSLLKNAGTYHVFWVDSSNHLWISTKPVSVMPRQNLAKSKREQQFWSVECKWVDLDLPQTYDAPVITYQAP